MNIKKIEEVVRMMEKHNLTEISIEEEGVKIHLRKGMGGIETAVTMQPHIVNSLKQDVPAPQVKEEKRNFAEVKAPMVGTFYQSPSPESKPFVEVGSMIKEGDVLCIIEAMKLMNEIKSEIKGKVVDILVENANPIEFGQVLFLVEPS